MCAARCEPLGLLDCNTFYAYDVTDRWLEELTAEIAQRQAALQKGHTDLERARELLAHHQQRQERDAKEARRKRLLRHVHEIEQALISALAELGELGEGPQRQSTHAAGWQPGEALVKAVSNQYLPQTDQHQQTGPRRPA